MGDPLRHTPQAIHPCGALPDFALGLPFVFLSQSPDAQNSDHRYRKKQDGRLYLGNDYLENWLNIGKNNGNGTGPANYQQPELASAKVWPSIQDDRPGN